MVFGLVADNGDGRNHHNIIENFALQLVGEAMNSDEGTQEDHVAVVSTSRLPNPTETSLQHIPEAQRIRVLYLDDHIVVVLKPGHLRSVPGHARNNDFIPSQPTGPRKRPRDDEHDQKLSGQQAWISAIRSFETNEFSPKVTEPAVALILRLAQSPTLLGSLPRKWTVFHRYIHRNKHRLLGSCDEVSEDLVKDVFERIQERYRAHLPEPTKPEDSALGQLRLLGIGRTDHEQRSGQLDDLYVVHRLDCETSGIMTFARSQSAASVLGKNWRQRDIVKKIYLAHVCHWPPFHYHGERTGSIDLPLKPSAERIKWQICSQADEGARASKTLWRIDEKSSNVGPVILELIPVTGRTHQLRIHCAAIGSGITGDSLYTELPGAVTDLRWDATESSSRLRLHAFQLSFPHPQTGEAMEFTSEIPSWCTSLSDK